MYFMDMTTEKKTWTKDEATCKSCTHVWDDHNTVTDGRCVKCVSIGQRNRCNA